MNFKQTTMGAIAAAALATGAAPAHSEEQEAIPRLEHVFVIMMENQYFGHIIGNPSAPFVNSYATTANLAQNYMAVGHPSLTNYLEVVGGSNFGVVNDNSPDWHNTGCQSNLETNTPSLEGAPNTC